MKAKYRFQRPKNSPIGFGRANRPSTDAIGALHQWIGVSSGRDFNIIVEDDDFIDAELLCDETDADAGGQLDTICIKFGLERSPLG